jgi:peptidyl-prolyl cis-trans isomerase D
MAGVGKKASNFVVWTILGLLVFALAGFGIGEFGGGVRSIGAVGDTEIPVDDYARALEAEIRARRASGAEVPSLSTPEGQRIALGVQRQLLGTAALDGETERLGLSVGDAEVRDIVLGIEAFQGLDGAFDRAAYAETLRRNGLTEDEFEAQIRREAARTLTIAAVTGSVAMPPEFVDTLLAYSAERRDILWVRLDASMLDEPLPEPSDTDLRGYYDANPDAFIAPEQRRVRYAVLTPEMIVAGNPPDEGELRQLYDQRATEFNLPERRLVERLIFPDTTAADAARAALDAGGQTFEALVTGRGLSLSDVDLGDVTRAELGAAGDPVFALQEPGVAGPVETPLGPALFRVNAILAATTTPFEEVRADLAEEVSMGRARREIADKRDPIDDLLAGGADLDELSAEAGMALGEVSVSEEEAEGIAGYAAFREKVEELTPESFPELVELEDGGLAVVELVEIVAPAPRDFDDVREAAAEGWRSNETSRRLLERAGTIRAARTAGASFEAQGLTVDVRSGLARESFLDGAPDGLIDAVFGLGAPGETLALEGDGGTAHLVELAAIMPPIRPTPKWPFWRRAFGTR